jgi:Flagellin and related hook-associated proteins
MIINHNVTALNAHRQLGINTGNIGKNIEKLSSGYRINRAADDAAGLSISEKMRAQIRGMSQAARNAQDGVSLIQTAEGALQTVNDILVRIKELATQSANGTYNDTDRTRIQEELTELAKEIKNIADNTRFNEIDLLNGSGTGSGADIDLQIGIDSSQTLTLEVARFNLYDLSGTDVVGTVSGWDLSSISGAKDVLSGIDDIIDAVSAARSYLGANQNRLENTINNLNINVENLTAAESRIRDVDMAREMMEFTKNNILTQASQAMLAQANQTPQGVLQLLR